MENFLKEFSIVPNEFINDFFKIAPEEYYDNKPIINFDKIVKWLNVQKGHLKRLLVKHFDNNYDYIIEVEKVKNKNGYGANYVENIFLTPDCFKELCMISQTKKAKLVRYYYLSLEKLIKKYHSYIKEKLYEKINLLENNQKPKINIRGGVIYFFRALNDIKLNDLEEDLYKIGKSKNIKKRFDVYNSGNANNIEPLFILEVDDIDKVESCIKNLLKEYQYRKYKEIYQINIDALKLVFVNCDNLVNSFKNYMKNTDSRITNDKFKKMRHSHHGLILFINKFK